MDRSLVIQSKQTNKVNICLLLGQMDNRKLSLADCVYHISHVCVNADIYVTFKSLCVFRKKKSDTSEDKWLSQVIQPLKRLCCTFLKILDPEQLQCCQLKWSSLIDYSSQDVK